MRYQEEITYGVFFAHGRHQQQMTLCFDDKKRQLTDTWLPRVRYRAQFAWEPWRKPSFITHFFLESFRYNWWWFGSVYGKRSDVSKTQGQRSHFFSPLLSFFLLFRFFSFVSFFLFFFFFSFFFNSLSLFFVFIKRFQMLGCWRSFYCCTQVWNVRHVSKRGQNMCINVYISFYFIFLSNDTMKKNLYSSNISTYPFRSYNKKKRFF